jgi:hypothetical protein
MATPVRGRAGRRLRNIGPIVKIEFFKGVLEPEPGLKIDASWARTPFGIMTVAGSPDAELRVFDDVLMIESYCVTSLDLPGLDREHLETIVENILKRRYLDKPGIRDKGEAVLYVLVNEALTEMAGFKDEDNEQS